MKLPFLPFYFDKFTREDSVHHASHSCGATNTTSPSSSSAGCVGGVLSSYFLTHFHTDHLKGLHPSWGIGYHPSHRTIYCSRITRALLVKDFGEALAPYVVALPMYQWIEIPVTSSYTVRCCLLPACHIPGSVQFLLETFFGRVLYTGDVKVVPHLLRVMHAVQSVAPVDHLYMDDTWLHLDRSEGPILPSPLAEALRNGVGDQTSDGAPCRAVRQQSTALNRLLSDDQLEEALEAIRKRTVGMCDAYEADRAALAAARDRQQRFADTTGWEPAAGHTSNATADLHHHSTPPHTPPGGDGEEVVAPIGVPLPPSEEVGDFLGEVVRDVMWRPFALRIYLHNHFGKEVILQRLAAKLGTTILVDDDRYQRLEAVASTFRADAHEELHLEKQAARFLFNAEDHLAATTTTTTTTVLEGERRRVLLASVSKCWDVDKVDISRFIPHSHLQVLCKSAWSGGDAEKDAPLSVVTVAARVSRFQSHPQQLQEGSGGHTMVPCMEVVNHRSLISPSALATASMPHVVTSQRGAAVSAETETFHATPHFGIVMTGWAKLHKKDLLAQERLWQLPYTMHSTPTELADLVSVLRPASVTPIHYDRERGSLVTARLGALLRNPFVNGIISGSTLLEHQVPLSLREYIFAEARPVVPSRSVVMSTVCGRLAAPRRGPSVGFPLRCSSLDDDENSGGSQGNHARAHDCQPVKRHRESPPTAVADGTTSKRPVAPLRLNEPPPQQSVSLSQLADDWCSS